MIYLKPITKENIIPVTDLEMEDGQKGFVELIHYPDNDRRRLSTKKQVSN